MVKKMTKYHEPKFPHFHFLDSNQQRIYEGLKELLGPGPAAFFLDACRLMADPYQFRTTAHLVGHLLREIESALRAIFGPLIETRDKETQKNEIHAILRLLGIHDQDRAAGAWFKLADNLYRLAHRCRLDAPRPPEEIRDLWNESHALLNVLLQSMRERFLSWFEVLDELLSKKRPTEKDLKKLAQEIPNNQVVRRYFFNRLESPEWLEGLRAEGFFRNPPSPEPNEEEGTIRYPPWPEARYLVRMAKHKPELVAEIIQEMEDTDNAMVLGDMMDALLAMPADISAQLTDKVKRWAERPHRLLPDKMGHRISHLAKGAKTEEATAIARVLLDILPDPRQQQVVERDQLDFFLPEPRARFDTWHYEQILKKHYQDLVRNAGLPALTLLCELLDKAIRLSLRCNDQGSYDGSEIWRRAIEDHPQNLDHAVKDALVSAVRDAAELIVRSRKAPLEQVVGAVEQRRWKVFHRIALHVLRKFPDQAKGLAAERLTNRKLFEDVTMRHEYILLLRKTFPHLSGADQSKILGWIEKGPGVDQWRESETGQGPTQEEISRDREIWQRDRLAWIGTENLSEKWRERYRQLVSKYGEADHPEFPVYTTSGVGPTSPKTADELRVMSVKEIAEFLRAWEPPENMFGMPSPEGLGRVLSSVVAEDPDRFATEAKHFEKQDPTYVRSLLFGLRQALEQGRSFDWESVLALCNWVISQPRQIQGQHVRKMNADPDWVWTHKEIARLLSAGFEARTNNIPIDLRQRVWAILKPLTDAPDPTPEHEQRYGGSNMDPATLSINTTRGEATHAVIRYALWVRRSLEKEPNARDLLQNGVRETPEAHEVLEAHLDLAREPSLAVRAVYGWWFPWLILLDSDWARAHATKVFPQDDESGAFFDAAWNAYIAFNMPYDNVFEILRSQYTFAVDGIGVRHKDMHELARSTTKVAEHLMVFYWRGKLSLDDSLFASFWQKAPDDVRAHALSFVGLSLEQTEGDISPEILERLKQLWEWRLDTAKAAPQRSDFEKEIAAFGSWFVSEKFEVGWSLNQLYAALEFAGKTELMNMVLEHLSMTAGVEPLLSVKCLRLIAEGDREGWELYSSSNHVRSILQQGLQNTLSKEQAERVVHYLGSRGFLDFRDLLKG